MRVSTVFFSLFLFFISNVFGTFPVAHQGRFHPSDVYIKQTLYDLYHGRKISEFSADKLIWNLHFNGPYVQKFPFLYIHSAQLKEVLGLPVKASHFTFEQVDKAILKNSDFKKLLNGKKTAAEAESLIEKMRFLKQQSFPDDPSLPVQERLRKAGEDFKALPYQAKPGEWVSLKALQLDIPNFTPYSDLLYQQLKEAYRQQDTKQLSSLLEEGYKQIAGVAFLKLKGKSLTYPTTLQLNAESLLYRYPWLLICTALYFLSFICGILFKKPVYLIFAFGAFALHTLILAIRCFVLERPPVSNMFETVIYVPWVAMTGGMILQAISRDRKLILSASLVNVLLLLLLEATQLNNRLDNVQAVLDSQYWLLIHVLMVVGSYGMFALAGVLGHLYLINRIVAGKETEKTRMQGRQVLQAIYLGTSLLIPGTILGGVWAAESWGRFWDWDPKESWAFISSCVYLIWIHAYRFNHIRYDGLAAGSIIGLMAISFTWYGVNYILGTGLHSYGFGSGGEGYYYLYLACEAIFLSIALSLIKSKRYSFR